jgi:hypothetical protein
VNGAREEGVLGNAGIEGTPDEAAVVVVVGDAECCVVAEAGWICLGMRELEVDRENEGGAIDSVSGTGIDPDRVRRC